MTITLLRRRVARPFRVQHIAHPPQDGIFVVEHEFEGGPFGGRRMTGFASTFDLQVVHSDRGRRPRLVLQAVRGTRLGTYRFERVYDCPRTHDRVHVYRWCRRRGADES